MFEDGKASKGGHIRMCALSGPCLTGKASKPRSRMFLKTERRASHGPGCREDAGTEITRFACVGRADSCLRTLKFDPPARSNTTIFCLFYENDDDWVMLPPPIDVSRRGPELPRV